MGRSLNPFLIDLAIDRRSITAAMFERDLQYGLQITYLPLTFFRSARQRQMLCDNLIALVFCYMHRT